MLPRIVPSLILLAIAAFYGGREAWVTHRTLELPADGASATITRKEGRGRGHRYYFEANGRWVECERASKVGQTVLFDPNDPSLCSPSMLVGEMYSIPVGRATLFAVLGVASLLVALWTLPYQAPLNPYQRR